MSKKVFILWGLSAVCVAVTVGLWFKMNEAELDYEEVEVKVLNAVTKQVKNRNNGSTYNSYEITVECDGEEYSLENVHSASGYLKGRTVTAYLSNGRLFANEEGVRTSTPVATVYFVFLFGSFGMLLWAAMETGKHFQKKREF